MTIKEQYKKIICSVLLFTIVFAYVQVLVPEKASAAWPVTVVADTSPTGIMNSVNHILEKLKNFVLDRLATAIANAILNQLTASVINWINTGFKGSPSFLTNPSGFFMDAADQVTGQFIAETGILSQLCSPFSINLRANLALGAAGTTQGKYICTIRTVVNNAKNIPNNINVNGQNIKGFMNGNFSQGGWPAFNSVMTDPQNDPFFSYHSAVSDVQASIAMKKSSVNFDLSLGSGLMSWQKCTPVPVGGTYIDASGAKTVNNPAPKNLVGPPAPPPQNCTTETPGSAISSSLSKTLGMPIDKLNLANNINAIIDALVSQMVMQVLGGGLRSMSSGSGGSPSYTSQIYNSTLASSTNSASSIYSQSGDMIGVIQEYKSNYDSSVSIIEGSQTNLNSAKTCLTTKYNALAAIPPNTGVIYRQNVAQPMSTIQSDLTSIDSTLQNQIQSLLSYLNQKAADGYAKLAQAQSVNMQLTSNSSAGVSSATAAATVATELQSGGGLDQSKQDLQNAQSTASGVNSTANNYSTYCNGVVIPTTY